MTRNKFHNKRTNGYASKREANRASELAMHERVGAICDLREQVSYELIPKQVQDGKVIERAVSWRADFVYKDCKTGEEIWEDCKGFKTPVYILKKKLVLWIYGKRITET